MKKRVVFLVCSLIVMPVAAQAAFTAAQRDACKADYETFCRDVIPGGGRIVKCLRDNAAKLRERCRAAVAEDAAARRGMREACVADYQKFCGSVTPGGGAIVKCLRQHEGELEPGCRKAVGAAGGAQE